MQNPFIVGDRIYLRPLDVEDTDPFVSWLSDTEIRLYLGITSPMSRLGEREYLKGLYKDERGLNLGIVLKDNDELIGAVGLHDISLAHRNAEIGIFIGNKDYWSKGYGSEALRLMMGHGFDQLNLHMIFLMVISHNKRAIRAYEKVGFKREAIFREHVYDNGEYHDDHRMSILKSEWRAL
jgi:RimJ/RimL family protein N-acetyltransferase